MINKHIIRPMLTIQTIHNCYLYPYGMSTWWPLLKICTNVIYKVHNIKTGVSQLHTRHVAVLVQFVCSLHLSDHHIWKLFLKNVLTHLTPYWRQWILQNLMKCLKFQTGFPFPILTSKRIQNVTNWIQLRSSSNHEIINAWQLQIGFLYDHFSNLSNVCNFCSPVWNIYFEN